VSILGFRNVAKLLKGFAKPARLAILQVLHEDGECCVCHLEHALGQRQTYISQQLARLRHAGLVKDRREGLNEYYALSNPEIENLLSVAYLGSEDVLVRSNRWTGAALLLTAFTILLAAPTVSTGSLTLGLTGCFLVNCFWSR
jgi:ArsR family transcriptional regulator